MPNRLRVLLALVVAAAAALALAPAANADVSWLCRPGMAANPCELPQDTTVREYGKADAVRTPAVDRERPVDCFYVYPTVSGQPTPNATKARDPELVSIAKYQAARFSRHCRVYAPIYRQTTLASIATGYVQPSTETRKIAYADVLEAWKSYLANDNGGRGVVFLGHSQGTRLLRQLIRTEIDPDPALRRRLVGGALIGANVTTRAGSPVGGDFANVPVCTQRAQLGCVVAFSSFPYDPPAAARFGISRPPEEGDPFALPGGPGFEIACTDPRPLAGVGGDPLELLIPSEPYAPGVIGGGVVISAGGLPPTASTTWVTAPDRYVGGCRRIGEANVLRYDPANAQSRAPGFFPEPNWGSHLIDMNLVLDPMVSLVGQQVDRYTRPQLRLTRTCRAGRLTVRLAGRDTSFVARLEVRDGTRVLARDTSAPFSKTLPRGRRVARLRAVATLNAGAPARLTLARTVPAGCARVSGR